MQHAEEEGEGVGRGRGVGEGSDDGVPREEVRGVDAGEEEAGVAGVAAGGGGGEGEEGGGGGGAVGGAGLDELGVELLQVCHAGAWWLVEVAGGGEVRDGRQLRRWE